MKKHVFPITLLFIAVISFVMSFCIEEEFQLYCGIASFAFPTVAAMIEIVFSYRVDKENEIRDAKLESIDKRTKWHII